MVGRICGTGEFLPLLLPTDNNGQQIAKMLKIPMD